MLIKFILRLLKHLFIFLFICLPLQITGILLLLVLCKFCKIGEIPKMFRYFDSADPFIGRDISSIQVVNNKGYWSRYVWLAWRNPINYFGYKILGIVIDKGAKQTVLKGNTNIGDSKNKNPGLYFTEVEQNGKTYYEYYYIKKYSSNTCFRFRLGHKLQDIHSGEYVQQVFVISPYKSYSGN